MIKEVHVTAAPTHIQTILKFHQDPGAVKLFECSAKEDLYRLGEDYPLEITSMAKRAPGGKSIEGYYMIGFCTPNVLDLQDPHGFKHAVIAYYLMNEADWRQYKDDIINEANRRKVQYAKNREALRHIKESN